MLASRWRLVLLLGLALAAAPAAGLVILSGDGKGNTTPPRPDPGWERFGTKAPCPPQCGLNYLHVGRGWILTARHATAQDVRFFVSGRVHAHVPGSEVYIGGRLGRVDLLLFRIEDPPDHPLLPIAVKRPPPGTPVLLVARGPARAEPLPGDPSPGFAAKLPGALRWGTNRVVAGQIGLDPRYASTRVLLTRFDRLDNPASMRNEAHAAQGDSGGAMFVLVGEEWWLAGILISATPAVYGGATAAADLAHYRSQILEVVGAAGPASGTP